MSFSAPGTAARSATKWHRPIWARLFLLLWIGALALTACSGGCRSSGPEPRKHLPPVETAVYDLPGLPFRMALPKGTEVMAVGKEVVIVVNPRRRYSSDIYLECDTEPKFEGPVSTTRLAIGTELHYVIRYEVDNGMGLPMTELIGRFAVAGRRCSVRCWQFDYDCLDALQTLSLRPGPPSE